MPLHNNSIFQWSGIATAHPDICTALPRNPTEVGTAYDLHNGPKSLPCSKLSLITLRARRTFLWGLVGTGSSSQHAPWHIHVSLCIIPWTSIHSYIMRIWHLPSFQIHKYTTCLTHYKLPVILSGCSQGSTEPLAFVFSSDYSITK